MRPTQLNALDVDGFARCPPVTVCPCGRAQAVAVIDIALVPTLVCEACLADHSGHIQSADSAAAA